MWTFEADIDGNPDDENTKAAIYAIELENTWRESQVPPLPPLPTDNPANLKASYQTVIARLIVTSIYTAHAHAADQSSRPMPILIWEEFQGANQSIRNQVLALLGI